MKLPQLSLRELFLLVVIVAMGCGWWLDHKKQVKARLSAEEDVALLEEMDYSTLCRALKDDGIIVISGFRGTERHFRFQIAELDRLRERVKTLEAQLAEGSTP